MAGGVLLDIDGVLTVSWHAIPGAVEALETIRAADIPVRFLTNTTSRTRAQVAALLVDAGFAVAEQHIVTATLATASYLASHHPGARCLVLNEGPLDDLDGVELVGFADERDASPDDDVDVVVVGSAGPSFTWRAMNRCARTLLAGATLVAMHGGRRWLAEDGIRVDGGSYTALLERAADATATVIGKPAPAMFHEALAAIAADAGDSVMIGDDPLVDVAAARTIGMRGVLVRTGKYSGPAVGPDAPEADAVLDSFARVPAWLGL